MQLRKIAVERTKVAALDEDVASAAKDDGAKPVPFGFEQEAGPASGRASASLASIGSIGRLDREGAHRQSRLRRSFLRAVARRHPDAADLELDEWTFLIRRRATLRRNGRLDRIDGTGLTGDVRRRIQTALDDEPLLRRAKHLDVLADELSDIGPGEPIGLGESGSVSVNCSFDVADGATQPLSMRRPAVWVVLRVASASIREDGQRNDDPCTIHMSPRQANPIRLAGRRASFAPAPWHPARAGHIRTLHPCTSIPLVS